MADIDILHVFILKIWSAPYTWTVRSCDWEITVQNGDERGSLDVIPSEISSSVQGRSHDPLRTPLPSPSPTSFSTWSLFSFSFLICSAVFTAFLPYKMKRLFSGTSFLSACMLRNDQELQLASTRFTWVKIVEASLATLVWIISTAASWQQFSR